MLKLGLLGFAQPWLLLALAALPVLWILLRVTPPAPRRQLFPAITLLTGLKPPEETPARTPLWLLLLRLFALTLIILGLAHPLINPRERLSGTGPLVLVVDDGWAAARNWPARLQAITGLLDQATREARPVLALTTAPEASGTSAIPAGLLPAEEARRHLSGLAPKPWPVDRVAAAETLAGLDFDHAAQVVWLSNGLEDDGREALTERLLEFGAVTVFAEAPEALPHLLAPPNSQEVDLAFLARRAGTQGEERLTATARRADGSFVGLAEVVIPAGESQALGRFELPAELRNRVTQIALESERNAGSVLLVDERWRRRPVGLVASGPLEDAAPFLGERYYLERALGPFTELRRGNVADLLSRELAVLVLPDDSPLVAADRDRIAAWVEAGGQLLRFAGPKMAEGRPGESAGAAVDELLPVRLRGGNRTFVGALTWDQPARLAPFEETSPFRGLPVPEDVRIDRQVLAEPSLDLADKTWARLTDGTPLVTATQRGRGRIVLVHTSANTEWSNLALSGLFVELLRRTVALSRGVSKGGEAAHSLPPVEIMNAFGVLAPPPPTVLPLDGEASAEGRIDARHPPGFYGGEFQLHAHNLGSTSRPLAALPAFPPRVERAGYGQTDERNLMPWLLTAALLILIADLVISLHLRGLLRPARSAAAALAAGVFAGQLLLGVSSAAAQQGSAGDDDTRALQATLSTRLAYVLTDVASVDEVSRAGLTGLSRVLLQRTSVEADDPLPVDLGRDELAFFPLIYWPITPEQRDIDDAAARKVNAYLKNGGTILFDLRDAGAGSRLPGQFGRNAQALQRLTRRLDIPPLQPVPPDHVLTKAFYLLQDFPGRFSGGTLWIETGETRNRDGVASVIVGSNDWAGAWAMNDLGRPLFAVIPGGERQREMAYRFGVNVTMFAMTGSYKADQVHVPFILERLGQ